MYETKQQVTQRKIFNGLRKQAKKIQDEKEKVWEILKTDTSKGTGWKGDVDNDVASYYCPYIPLGVSVIRNEDTIINLETTA